MSKTQSMAEWMRNYAKEKLSPEVEQLARSIDPDAFEALDTVFNDNADPVERSIAMAKLHKRMTETEGDCNL